VLAIYVFYYFGVVGAAEGASSSLAFANIFGESGGRIMLLFVTLSCLGALNGLTMSVVRGHYVLSRYLGRSDRDNRLFGEISEKTGIPVLSGVMGLLVSEAWLLLLLVAEGLPKLSLGIDPAEASISVMYAIYVPILLMMTVRIRSESPMKGYVLPILGAFAAAFVAIAAPVAYGGAMLVFCGLVAAVALAVLGLYRR
jgi:APA family basic amino acid/polyamine antiporter